MMAQSRTESTRDKYDKNNTAMRMDPEENM